MKTHPSALPTTETLSSSTPSGLPSGMDKLAHDIARVERRLIARELGLQDRVQQIRQRTRSALKPRRSMMPWAGGLVLLWPLLPRFLRPRFSPSTAVTLFTMGLPLVKRLVTSLPAGPTTVAEVDLSRYMGQWHEVACLPHGQGTPGAGQVTLELAPAPRREGVSWLNVREHRTAPGGRRRETRGVARVVAGSRGARMKLSFLPSWMRWWPGAWDDHWVLHVNNDYTEALVGDPGRQRLRVLSRSAVLEPARLSSLLELARQQGYDTGGVRAAPDPAR